MFSDDKNQAKVVRYFGSTGNKLFSLMMKVNLFTQGMIKSNTSVKTETQIYAWLIVQPVLQQWSISLGNSDLEYTGHPSANKTEQIEPYGIATDSQSRILKTDSDNHCIHILDADGQFLRFIDNCDLEYPQGLCVDNNDSLFVCEYFKCIVKKSDIQIFRLISRLEQILYFIAIEISLNVFEKKSTSKRMFN